MKHIKQFEAFPSYSQLTTEAEKEKDKKELCWIIPTKKYQLKASLRKIGAPESIIERWGLSPNDINPIIDPKIYVFKEQNSNRRVSESGWIWEKLTFDTIESIIKTTIFKGEIIPTQKEIDFEKLKEISDKYNV